MSDNRVVTIDPTALRAELATRLGEPGARPDGAPRSVLGAGARDDDALRAGRAYLEALADTPYAVPAWPVEDGGMGADPATTALVAAALAEHAVPDLYPVLIGLAVAGPTIVALGPVDQRRRGLPGIRDGREIWCQLFSEPDAGSDLANVGTRATRDGDHWRVRGTKVWSSRAHYAQRGLLLARSDADVPKHRGITAFGIDMSGSGVDVRPLRQMNGDAHFSVVHLDDVVVADADRVGEIGGGWQVAMTALAHERGAAAPGAGSGLDFAALVALARDREATGDGRVRQDLARVYIDLRLQSLTARRARAMAQRGRPGPEGSGMKLRGTRTFVGYTRLALALLGPDALVHREPWSTLWLTAPSLSIRGGTDEIQRNIVGEHVLGLPGEPRVDRDRPWSSVSPPPA
jgi:alkylation response protein AidB-like acyl-CoA dehydrogenase